MAVTEADIIDALRPVQDPELHRSIVDLGMVRTIGIDGKMYDMPHLKQALSVLKVAARLGETAK